MRSETRRAALRAAAKVAIVVSLGCGPPRAEPVVTRPPETTAEPASTPTCAEHLAGLEVVSTDGLPEGDPLREEPNAYEAFVDVGARTDARTLECCTEGLVASGSGAPHRFACCSALGDVPEGADPTACTPWGPPCPPELHG